ncbi:MAG: methyltransferase domain-containing protein [Planctomycetota bacterium]
MPATQRTRVVVALILLVVAAALGSRVHLDGDLARLLPDSDPVLKRAQDVLRRTLQRAVFDVVGTLEDARRFEQRIGETYTVRAALDEDDVLELVDILRDRAPLLIHDYDAVGKRLEDVPGTLRRLARRLQEPDGAHLGARAGIDPLGIADLALEPLAGLASGLSGARLADGFLTSRDGRHRLVFVDPGYPPADTRRTEGFLRDVAKASEGLTVRHLGAHRSTLDNARTIESDARLTLAVGSVLVLALALLVFRRPGVAVLAITPALFGGAVALAAVSFFTDSIAAAVVGFSAGLLGIAIDYAVHVFYARKIPVRAILMGATTTAAAFLALRASSLPGLREAGLLGAIGIVAAALFAIRVLPPRAQAGRQPLDLSRIARVLGAWPVLGLLSLAAPVVFTGVVLLGFEGDPRAMSRLSDAAQQDENEILAVWGDSFRITTVLVEAAGLEDALARNEAVAASLEDRAHASLAGILPSRATQQRRLALWRSFWTEERVLGLRAEFARAVEGTPFRADAFEPFFASLTAEPPPLRPDDLPEAVVRERLQRIDGRWVVSTPVFDVALTALEGATVVSGPALARRLAELVGDELVTLGLLALGAVAVVVGLWFGRPGPALIVLLPLVASGAWTLGLLGWLGVPLTLANAVFIVFLFGLAVDYAIFLVNARLDVARGEPDRGPEAASAVLLCALTTCGGFFALALAGHPVLHSIGVTALIGIASAAVITLAVVPRLARFEPGKGSVAALFRYQGHFVSRYAAAKARHDPVVTGCVDLCRATEGDILVAGCGWGVMTAQLALALPGRRIVAMDSDPRKIATAHRVVRDFPDVEVMQGDLFTARPGGFGLVVLVDVLHYWTEPEQEKLMANVSAAVAPGGTLLFREGCADESGHGWVVFFERLARRTGFTRVGGSDLHFRSASGWRTLMEETGLVVERSVPELGAGSNVVFLCSRTKN